MTEEQANNLPKKRRIFELDLLRGFFVVIIIIDHLQLWPSPLRYLTGEGRLWVTAAEGFFLISGLLVGYIRGFKNKDKSLKDISIKLIKRAGILYIWGVGITLAIIFFTKMYGGGSVILPDLPNKEQMESIPHLLWAIISTDYFSPWIYFLRLYAIMLLVTPLFILLLRQGKYHIIIFLMATIYYLSKYTHEAALEWQLLFFGAALIGYKLDSIIDWLSKHRKLSIAINTAIISSTIITICTSFFFTHGWDKVEDSSWKLMDINTYTSMREIISPYVTSDPLALTRIILSYVWFAGFLILFKTFGKWIKKIFGWLLTPLGQMSLSAYCLQALVLPVIVAYVEPSEDGWRNMLISLAIVILIWGMLKIKIVRQLIPQ